MLRIENAGTFAVDFAGGRRDRHNIDVRLDAPQIFGVQHGSSHPRLLRFWVKVPNTNSEIGTTLSRARACGGLPRKARIICQTTADQTFSVGPRVGQPFGAQSGRGRRPCGVTRRNFAVSVLRPRVVAIDPAASDAHAPCIPGRASTNRFPGFSREALANIGQPSCRSSLVVACQSNRHAAVCASVAYDLLSCLSLSWLGARSL
jgi:hypothetical protein